jgi:prephenate dehydrogenase
MNQNLQISVLGVGLVGGSLGMAIRNIRSTNADADTGRCPYKVVGFDSVGVLERAIARGAIDQGAQTPGDAVRDADIVVLAAPLAANLGLMRQIKDHVKPGAIITDVGSVKVAIEDEAKRSLPDHVVFIGGHPMAGSERQGVESADPFLFENATYVLCPPDPFTYHPSQIGPLISLLQLVGARILMLPSRKHDRIAATTSHVPQLVAVALAGYAATENELDENVHRLAAGGFRDMTRIASSPFGLWKEILSANHGAVLEALAGFSAQLLRVRNRLVEERFDDLQETFDQARVFRESVPKSTKGFLRPLSDVYISAADRPGALHSITRVLFENDLNIKDIELLKLREGTGGTFRVGFDSDIDASRAVDVLIADGHRAHIL